MSKDKISDYSETPGNNTDIGGINIAEGMLPSDVNNAIREQMAQLKKFQSGTSGESVTFATVNATTVSTSNINKVTVTAPATSATLTIANGKTLTANNSLTLAGTDATTMTFPTTSATIARTDAAQTFSGTQTFSCDASINSLTVGRGAGAVSTNTAVGSSALAANTTGARNTAVGHQAGCAMATNCFNVYVGSFAGLSATGGSNTAVGDNSQGNASNSGSFNSSLGQGSLTNNTTGSNNTAVGYWALLSNTTASGNVAVGFEALCANTTCTENVAVGFQALKANTSRRNTAVGACALLANTTGCENTALGTFALFSNTTACNNIGVGVNAGRCSSGLTPQGLINLTTQSNRIVMGNDDHTCAQIKIAWTATSDCRDKLCFAPIALGLDFVRALKPTEYQFKAGGRNSTYTDGKRRYGFLAQDILPLEGENPVIISADDPEKLQYTEAHLIPVLVKAIQELAAELEALKNA